MEGPPSIVELFRTLGNPRPPKTITEQAFDHSQEPLERLASLRPGDVPDEADLIDYALDLKYVSPLQRDLMVYVLPFCLESWFAALTANRAIGFTQEFHASLAKRAKVIGEAAGRDVELLVREYMRQGLLYCMAQQNSLVNSQSNASPFLWVGHLASYGSIWDDVEVLVREWRKMRIGGHAICCLQYLSVFAFRTFENPIFSPWTREGGGGPPAPWEYESLGFEECWKETNLEFLRGFLTTDEMERWAMEAAANLRDHPHFNQASAVVEGIAANKARIESRLEDLIRFLGTPSKPGGLDWSDYDA